MTDREAGAAVKGTDDIARRHRRVAAAAVALVLAMLGLAYASVPLYRLICAATGLGGTTQRVVANAATADGRTVTIRFDANLASGMPWEFRPEARKMEVKLGETAIAFFRARNPTGHAVTGTATFNVTPEIAGRFFNKIQCFCFDQQTLKAGEAVDLPVTFYVDPALLDEPGAEGVREITLSYTFFTSAEVDAGETKPEG